MTLKEQIHGLKRCLNSAFCGFGIGFILGVVLSEPSFISGIESGIIFAAVGYWVQLLEELEK